VAAAVRFRSMQSVPPHARRFERRPVGRSGRARRLAALGLLATPLLAISCGPVTVADSLEHYREGIEAILGAAPAEGAATPRPQLPRRRERRLAFADQRMGPFDFLGILGCPLSELVAARNAPLGKVLEPTRRLAHELAVLSAGRECLPRLGAERAERLRARLSEKRSDLAAHRWNAVWLDEDLERFLSSGPRALIGGENPADGSRQLARAAAALSAAAPSASETDSFEAPDVAAIEASFAELRDDPAMGSTLVELDRVRLELAAVAALVGPVAGGLCGERHRRLEQVFRTRYLPLQSDLGSLDRRAGPLLDALAMLYRASAEGVEAPEPMARFADEVLGNDRADGLWSRYRRAVLDHARAWSPLLEACGVLPSEAA